MHGKLNGKRVQHDFTPACENCRFFQECALHPRHPAYPHPWPWAHEAIPLPDGTQLVVLSYVGSSQFGARHRGCTHYEVNEAFTLPTNAPHEQLFVLRREMEALIQKIQRMQNEHAAERLWDKYDDYADEYERLLRLLETETRTHNATEEPTK